MVVLSSSICTRGGKALLSRQFRDLSKDRITALLSNFPSLISNSSGQHTTIEDDNVRYVYQPLEEFYIVLITNKTSNILQDLDTLQLFASTISNLLKVVDEREIFENAFEIISAFDEIINLGYKENITLNQIETYLKMDSHEEKIQEIIERNKEMEATEERKRRAKEIQRKELAKRNLEQIPVSSPASYNTYQSSTIQESQSVYQPPVIDLGNLSVKKPMVRGGLQLGKKKENKPLLGGARPIFEGAQAPAPVQAQAQTPTYQSQVQTPSNSASPIPTSKVPNEGILITVNEKITASLTREGSINSSEIKGDLQLRINDVNLAHSKILLKTGDKSLGIQYKTHPNVDRNLFTSSNIIGLKDKTKPFPSNDQALGVLRWRAVGKQDDLSLVPIIITAWVNINDQGVAEVTLEYELTSSFITSHQESMSSLENIQILVPIVTSEVDLDDSNETVSFEVTEYGVVFTIGSVSFDDPQGSFEFKIPTVDEDSLFPLSLSFEVTCEDVKESISLGKVQVVDVVSNNEEEESLKFDLHLNLTSEGYQVN